MYYAEPDRSGGTWVGTAAPEAAGRDLRLARLEQLRCRVAQAPDVSSATGRTSAVDLAASACMVHAQQVRRSMCGQLAGGRPLPLAKRVRLSIAAGDGTVQQSGGNCGTGSDDSVDAAACMSTNANPKEHACIDPDLPVMVTMGEPWTQAWHPTGRTLLSRSGQGGTDSGAGSTELLFPNLATACTAMHLALYLSYREAHTVLIPGIDVWPPVEQSVAAAPLSSPTAYVPLCSNKSSVSSTPTCTQTSMRAPACTSMRDVTAAAGCHGCVLLGMLLDYHARLSEECMRMRNAARSAGVLLWE
eukprot:251152-Chlamydomonas_euryale.AAC.8